jgi:hypothetical protein
MSVTVPEHVVQKPWEATCDRNLEKFEEKKKIMIEKLIINI